MSAPGAPWRLEGEAIVTLARAPGRRGDAVPAARRLPGPLLVVGARFTASPVGPYLEFAVCEPAMLRGRPGWSITTMVVDSPASRLGGRMNWGFPRELGTLRWTADGETTELRWVDRGIVIRATPRRFRMPAALPVRAIQHSAEGAVIVPGRLRGWLRGARVEVEAPLDDPLEVLAGTRPGGVLSSFAFVVGVARRPSPRRAPAPAAGSA
jgi:hypothetical protein